MDRSRRAFLQLTGGAAGTALIGLAARATRRRSPPLLRPPGARDEVGFLARCIRCQQCVAACPADVLQLAAPSTGLAMGTPFVEPRHTACNLCQGEDEMRCIPACPSGALQPVARRQDVRMGLATIDESTCLPFVGVSCKACWHACPFAREAITFDARGRPAVVEDRCVGCGLCEYACLTTPASIRVVPFAGHARGST